MANSAPNFLSIIDAFQQGQQMREHRSKLAELAEIGKLASTGNYMDAAGRAYGGGYLAEGSALAKLARPDLGEGGGYGLNLVYGLDDKGNTVAFQPSKSGGVRPVEFPKGVKPTPGMSFQDMGTFVQPFNSKTGVPGSPMPKDVAGTEQQKVEGKGKGEAIVNLPKAEGVAANMLASIDGVINDPYLGSMVGPVAGKWLPNVTADAHRVQSKLDQLTGQSFLQAFETLKGAGQITEVEGTKATQAIARLNTAQSEADFRQALNELRGVVSGAAQRARTMAGQGRPQGAAPAENIMSNDPQAGQVVNGYKIGATARNQAGQVIVWDGNGWRPQ